jgi:hypothetical protein
MDNSPFARGGLRRYLDTTPPEEYNPDYGEVNLQELSLTGLADLYGSDKGTIKHNYCVVYDKLIKSIVKDKSKAELTVGEVGVACGASLRMWANYLPKSKIYGFDIQPDCSNLCKDLENVEIIIDDITKPTTTNVNVFDLFVDDGSHISEDIIKIFESCWSWVKSGGYYVIEDLSCTYKPEYTEQCKKNFNRPDIQNKRDTILLFVDALMKHCDAKTATNIGSLEYYPQMLVIKKK